VVASSGANALELLSVEEEKKLISGCISGSSMDEIDAIIEVDDHTIHLQPSPKHGFDAILCDIEMPDLDGFGTAVKIRELERRFAAAAADNDGRGRRWPEERMPIIALSAFHSEEYRVRCRESGMDDYLCKPVKKDALVSCLAKWCDDPSALWRLLAASPVSSDHDNNSDSDEIEVQATLVGGSGNLPFEFRATA
jgi:CheY-like chemotaxis protein